MVKHLVVTVSRFPLQWMSLLAYGWLDEIQGRSARVELLNDKDERWSVSRALNKPVRIPQSRKCLSVNHGTGTSGITWKSKVRSVGLIPVKPGGQATSQSINASNTTTSLLRGLSTALRKNLYLVANLRRSGAVVLEPGVWICPSEALFKHVHSQWKTTAWGDCRKKSLSFSLIHIEIKHIVNEVWLRYYPGGKPLGVSQTPSVWSQANVDEWGCSLWPSEAG